MNCKIRWTHVVPLFAMIVLLAAATGLNSDAAAQAAQRGQQPPRSPQAAAPIDLTGYWVSIVTEDWRFRMVTPSKGDYASLPLNAEGRRVADTWDLAKDEAAGNQCKAFGVGNVMRNPGRVRITWENENTLRIDTDAGTQTRQLHFGESQPPAQPTWQGHSVASWEMRAQGRGQQQPRGGSLKVVTTHMRPGYLRKNGVPYSENTVVTEYFDRHSDYGAEWFTVTTIVNDPKYLTDEFITSTHFRKEPDGSKFSPTPCETPRPAK